MVKKGVKVDVKVILCKSGGQEGRGLREGKKLRKEKVFGVMGTGNKIWGEGEISGILTSKKVS